MPWEGLNRPEYEEEFPALTHSGASAPLDTVLHLAISNDLPQALTRLMPRTTPK